MTKVGGLVAEQLLAELKALGLPPRQGDEAPGGIGQRQDVALVVEVLGDARRRGFCFRCASVRLLVQGFSNGSGIAR